MELYLCTRGGAKKKKKKFPKPKNPKDSVCVWVGGGRKNRRTR